MSNTRFWACIGLISVVAAVAASAGCQSSPQAREAKALKRGASLLHNKDYARASLEFRNASQAMPNDAEPYYQLGLTYLAMGDLRDAVVSFRQATDRNPKHVGAQIKLAEVLTASREKTQVEEASRRLETVLANAPGNAEANNTLAIAEWKLGQSEDAVARLEETLRSSPANLQAAIALARMRLSVKDVTGAEDIVQRSVASAPNSPQAALALAQLYWVAKELGKAEAEFHRVLQLDPQNGPALTGLAAIEVTGHRMEEAEETYKRLAALPGKRYKHVHAVFLFQEGKRDAALAELKQLAQDDPEDREARSRLLAAYVSMGKTAEAQQLLANVLKKNAKDTDALFQRAELYLRAGNAESAESDLKQVLYFKPDSAEAHFALAEVYRASQSSRSERQELSEALRINSNLLPARLALARNFMLSGDAKSALETLDQTPQPQKGLLSTVTERNWALFMAGNVKEMRTILDQALKVGRYPELLVQDGVLRMQQGDFVGARAAADEILARNSADLRAARILADSYEAQKQPAKAIERLRELVQGHPKSAPLQYLLAEHCIARSDFANARQALEAALAADPSFIQADLSLARLDYQEKHPDQAQQRLTRVLNVDPKNIPALSMLAAMDLDAGRHEDAIAKYRTVLDIDGSNIVALNNLAWNLAPQDPDEALKYALQAAEVAPKNAAVHDTLGWIYYRKGIYGAAVDYLKNAVAEEPTPRRQFHLAMCYMKAGDRELGRKLLASALQKDPNLMTTERDW